MKLFAALLVSFFASSALASDFVSEMEKTFKRYSLCSPDDSEQFFADLEFRDMVATLKDSQERGKKSRIEILDFNVNFVRLLDTSIGFECEIRIDGYDGRCYSAFCN